jgi:hypothetical protein
VTRRMTVAQLLEELREEFTRGRIIEARLDDPVLHLDGLKDGESVIVDPAPSIVETLLHELLHRRYPSWCERRVDSEAKRALQGMTQAQLTGWYKRYQRAKRVARRPVHVED